MVETLGDAYQARWGVRSYLAFAIKLGIANLKTANRTRGQQ